MNEQVQPAAGDPLFNPLSPDFIRNPYPHYDAAAHHRPGPCDAVRPVRRQPPCRGQPGPARQAFRQGFCRAHDAPLWSPDHERAGVPQHESLDAAGRSARSHPPARSRREGLHRAPGRGHAAPDPGDRRPGHRCSDRARPHGPDRGFRLPPAGHHHLRDARNPRGSSRGLLQQLARRRPAARPGADVARGDREGQRRQHDGADVLSAAVRIAPPHSRGRSHHPAGAGRGGRQQAQQ